MPPLRPPGVGEPTVPTTRSASAERVFRFWCRGFDTPPVPMLSATVPMLSAPVRPFAVRSVRPFAPCSPVSLPRARPFLCSPYPPVAVYPHAVRACSFLCSPCRPSPFISALSGPVCPTLSGHIYSCAARRHPFLAARASRSPHCPSPFHLFPVRGHPVGRLRHDGRSLDLSPRGFIYIGAAENSNGSTTERRLDRQKPGFCGTAGCAGCRSRTGALSSRRRYFCGKLL